MKRHRRSVVISPVEKLLADSSLLPLYRASGETVGISGGRARLFGSRSPEAILDALRLEGRGGAAHFRSVPTPCAHHDCSHSHMGETKFVRWTVKRSELPLSWDDALLRFSRERLQ
jgi:hypothetical protein